MENTGIPIPGETITIVGGFLAGSGELGYWIVLGSAIAGAVIGDNFGYWIGRWGGWPLLIKVGSFFNISTKQLEGVRNKFSKNAAKAVFFGRFVTLLRVFAGPIAGIAQMPYYRFLLCNLGGATVWALIMVSLSFFVGRLVPLPELIHWITQFGILALILVIAWVGMTLWLEFGKPGLEGKD